jgi:hypothetical protein
VFKSQKTASFIVTAVKTSNLMRNYTCTSAWVRHKEAETQTDTGCLRTGLKRIEILCSAYLWCPCFRLELKFSPVTLVNQQHSSAIPSLALFFFVILLICCSHYAQPLLPVMLLLLVHYFYCVSPIYCQGLAEFVHSYSAPGNTCV